MQSTCKNRNGLRGTASRLLPDGWAGLAIAFVLLLATGAFAQLPEADAPAGTSADERSASQVSGDIESKQRLARLMLDDARQWAERGWTDAARRLARRAAEQNVTWQPDEESPESFLRRLDDKDALPPPRHGSTEPLEQTTNPLRTGRTAADRGGPPRDVQQTLFNDASNTGRIPTVIVVPANYFPTSGTNTWPSFPFARPAAANEATSTEDLDRGELTPGPSTETVARHTDSNGDRETVALRPTTDPRQLASSTLAISRRTVVNSRQGAVSSQQVAGGLADDRDASPLGTSGGMRADNQRGSLFAPASATTILATLAGAICAAAGTLVLTRGRGLPLPSLLRIEVVHRSEELESAQDAPGVDEDPQVARRVRPRRSPRGPGEAPAHGTPVTAAVVAANVSSSAAVIDPILECVIEQNQKLQDQIAERFGERRAALARPRRRAVARG